jgi:dissimilatory sulfite reductase (desulfoviridin) alpha/beta subunit
VSGSGDLLDALLEAEDLELDFSDSELAKAQEPLLPDGDQSPEATRLLTEAPWPSGAMLESGGDLEPVLAMAGDLSPEEEGGPGFGAGPPSFFPRLGYGTAGPLRVEAVAPKAWSLASGESWPDFVQRLHPPKADQAAWLKRVALAARRHAENRLCLGPAGELDAFFNDRGSLQSFRREVFGSRELASDPYSGGPVRILACRGLFGCPFSAVDSMSAAGNLAEIAYGHLWPKIPSRKRRPVILAVRGCQAGPGLGCGVYEYADLILTGRRRALPAIDQDLASISPRLSFLILGCPSKALRRSHLPGVFVELDGASCQRCGWCVSQDLSFSWPEPQQGYLSAELSGRRIVPPWEHVAPMTLWAEAGSDSVEIGAKILSLLELWRREADETEILADFALRRGLLEGGTASGSPPGPNHSA